jgi:hypothetical protein
MAGSKSEFLRPDQRERLELVLLRNLSEHAAELRKLLEETSGHWFYEDGVYRFYHQSFKVFFLQESTQSVVAALERIAPEGRGLCSFFREVVRAGTGREFHAEDNEHWIESTAPVVQAFLHARYFLEMAVKYAQQFTEPPQPMPSGYAALLCLYDIR